MTLTSGAAAPEAFDDAADLLDELAGGLGDAIDRLGVEKIEQNLRLAAGLVRARADQLRNRKPRDPSHIKTALS